MCDESFDKVSSMSESIMQACIRLDCSLGGVQLCGFNTIEQMMTFQTFINHGVSVTADIMCLF
jgi:hypothetical protein